MSASVLLSGVAASFGARPLFSGLDLTLAPGDVTALVGPNGSGKTTLLRIVAGEHAADSGTVRLSPPGASVGYLPQAPPSPQDIPHAPQCIDGKPPPVARFTHRSKHHTSPDVGHAPSHRPALQLRPLGQRLLHAPQFAASFNDCSHPFAFRPSQSPNPGRHATREHVPDGEHSARALG